MQAVITVVGKDQVGILAKVSSICAQQGVNVEEVTQSILRGTFAMIMMVEVPDTEHGFKSVSEQLAIGAKELGVDIHITRQELYEAMHHV